MTYGQLHGLKCTLPKKYVKCFWIYFSETFCPIFKYFFYSNQKLWNCDVDLTPKNNMFLSKPYKIKTLITSITILLSNKFCKFTTNSNESALILSKINVRWYYLKAQYLNNTMFNIKHKPLTLVKILGRSAKERVFYLCIYLFIF